MAAANLRIELPRQPIQVQPLVANVPVTELIKRIGTSAINKFQNYTTYFVHSFLAVDPYPHSKELEMYNAIRELYHELREINFEDAPISNENKNLFRDFIGLMDQHAPIERTLVTFRKFAGPAYQALINMDILLPDKRRSLIDANMHASRKANDYDEALVKRHKQLPNNSYKWNLPENKQLELYDFCGFGEKVVADQQREDWVASQRNELWLVNQNTGRRERIFNVLEALARENIKTIPEIISSINQMMITVDPNGNLRVAHIPPSRTWAFRIKTLSLIPVNETTFLKTVYLDKAETELAEFQGHLPGLVGPPEEYLAGDYPLGVQNNNFHLVRPVVIHTWDSNGKKIELVQINETIFFLISEGNFTRRLDAPLPREIRTAADAKNHYLLRFEPEALPGCQLRFHPLPLIHQWEGDTEYNLLRRGDELLMLTRKAEADGSVTFTRDVIPLEREDIDGVEDETKEQQLVKILLSDPVKDADGNWTFPRAEVVHKMDYLNVGYFIIRHRFLKNGVVKDALDCVLVNNDLKITRNKIIFAGDINEAIATQKVLEPDFNDNLQFDNFDRILERHEIRNNMQINLMVTPNGTLRHRVVDIGTRNIQRVNVDILPANLATVEARINYLKDYKLHSVIKTPAGKIKKINFQKIRSYALLDEQTIIDKDNWTATLINTHEDKCSPSSWGGHAMLVFEGIKDGAYFMHTAHIRERPDGSDRLIEFQDEDFESMIALRENRDHYSRSKIRPEGLRYVGKTKTWSVAKKDVQKIFDSINEEIRREIQGDPLFGFSLFGGNSTTTRKMDNGPSRRVKAENCMTWARKKLALAGIDVPLISRSFTGRFVTVPKDYTVTTLSSDDIDLIEKGDLPSFIGHTSLERIEILRRLNGSLDYFKEWLSGQHSGDHRARTWILAGTGAVGTGAVAGAAAGPIGAAIGAGVGFIVGTITGGTVMVFETVEFQEAYKRMKPYAEEQLNVSTTQLREYISLSEIKKPTWTLGYL